MNPANAVVHPLHPPVAPSASTSTAAASTPSAAASTSAAPDRDAELAWFSLARHRWNTLLLVPAAGADPSGLARAMVEVAARSGAAVQWVDARQGSVETLTRQLALLQESARAGVRTLVLVDPPSQGPGALALESGSDAAVLCLARGSTRMDEARAVISTVGPGRFIGSLLLS